MLEWPSLVANVDGGFALSNQLAREEVAQDMNARAGLSAASNPLHRIDPDL